MKKINEDSFAGEFETSTLMVLIDEQPSNEVSLLPGMLSEELIKEEDIYNDDTDEYGREVTYHITIAHGMDDSLREEIIEFVEAFGPVEVALGPISFFRNDEEDIPYDVCKLSVISEDLERLNAELREMFEFSTNWAYNPHLTLAYIRKGACTDLEGFTMSGELPEAYEPFSLKNISLILPSKERIHIELES